MLRRPGTLGLRTQRTVLLVLISPAVAGGFLAGEKPHGWGTLGKDMS